MDTTEIKKKIILVVEDDRALNQAVVFKLEKMGYESVPVFNAEDALRELEKRSKEIDFIWLDILLPGMNGLEFLKRIRAEDGLKDKKVAIVSVSGGYDKEVEAKSMGAVDFIVKSDYDLDDIVDKVSKYIG